MNKPTRLPLAVDLQNRTNSTAKDARIVNGYVDKHGEQAFVVKRPGSAQYYTPPVPAIGQGLYNFQNKLMATVGGNLYSVASSGLIGNLGTSLSAATAAKITEIQLIPGMGEEVYATTPSAIGITNNLGVTTYYPSNTHASFSSAASPTAQPPATRTDLMVSLDNLQAALPNLQWVSVVTGWIGDSVDAGLCTIKPRTEYATAQLGGGTAENFPNAWSVGTWTRANTPVVAMLNGAAAYGGTPSDRSLIELCTELKRRGLKVMFYPLIFMESVGKPWRGRIIPANGVDAANWFTKVNGYNAYITHYSTLTALTAQIDAFVVGSEYVGLTSFMSAPGVFPAVTGFANLAATVRAQLPVNVKTVYAADWSEYHHAAGGWFNMDELFSNPNLDIIGIDNYMPLTPDLDQTLITPAKIQQYWQQGEGWDYYYDNHNTAPGFSYLPANPITTTIASNIVTLNLTGFTNHNMVVGQTFTMTGLTTVGGVPAATLNATFTVNTVVSPTSITFLLPTPATITATGGGTLGTIDKPKWFGNMTYAWKNIEYWWSTAHINPNGIATTWTPKMKPLWFTEYGFPSVDGCANQPNVFVDPTSTESAYPRASKRLVDNLAQAEAIGATIDFWNSRKAVPGNANLVVNKFLWTWDARPYPTFPDKSSPNNGLAVWADGPSWKTGHWINGKIGVVFAGLGTLLGPLGNGRIYSCATVTTPYLFMHNLTAAWTYNGTTGALTQVTSPNFPPNLVPPVSLVPGAVYMNNTVFVLTTKGRVYNSAIENPTVWAALDFIGMTSEADTPVALAKSLNYLIAFGQWSTEFLYYAGNPTGSPLAVNLQARLEIGCASSNSVVQLPHSVIFVGGAKEAGRTVYMLSGMKPQKISTRPVEHFLNNDPLTNVSAFVMQISGHTFYILNLKDSNLTLVYDIDTGLWFQWTSTVNGVEQRLENDFYASVGSTGYVQNGNLGYIAAITLSQYTDEGQTIPFRIVTPLLDNNNNVQKFFQSLEVIGDRTVNPLSIRHTDDDYTTWTPYRQVDMSKPRPIIRQLGVARRRAFEIYDSTPQALRLAGVDIMTREGTF